MLRLPRFLRRLLKRFLLCTAALIALWAGGFIWFMWQVPGEPAGDPQTTDAIVVLTGGSGRIRYGLKLLAEGRASKLFISGVEGSIAPDRLVALHQPALVEKLAGKNSVVILGYDARNTIGNAAETSQWMRREHLSSIRLVTANYHMPRALKEFRFAMPDITMIADPVMPGDFDIDDWWRPGTTSRQLLSEYHKYLASALRHWIIRTVEDH